MTSVNDYYEVESSAEESRECSSKGFSTSAGCVARTDNRNYIERRFVNPPVKPVAKRTRLKPAPQTTIIDQHVWRPGLRTTYATPFTILLNLLLFLSLIAFFTRIAQLEERVAWLERDIGQLSAATLESPVDGEDAIDLSMVSCDFSLSRSQHYNTLQT